MGRRPGGVKEVRPLPDVKLTVWVDTTSLDEAMKKLERLHAVLSEANSLAKELASTELILNVEL